MVYPQSGVHVLKRELGRSLYVIRSNHKYISIKWKKQRAVFIVLSFVQERNINICILYE